MQSANCDTVRSFIPTIDIAISLPGTIIPKAGSSPISHRDSLYHLCDCLLRVFSHPDDQTGAMVSHITSSLGG